MDVPDLPHACMLGYRMPHLCGWQMPGTDASFPVFLSPSEGEGNNLPPKLPLESEQPEFIFTFKLIITTRDAQVRRHNEF